MYKINCVPFTLSWKLAVLRMRNDKQVAVTNIYWYIALIQTWYPMFYKLTMLFIIRNTMKYYLHENHHSHYISKFGSNICQLRRSFSNIFVSVFMFMSYGVSKIKSDFSALVAEIPVGEIVEVQPQRSWNKETNTCQHYTARFSSYYSQYHQNDAQ